MTLPELDPSKITVHAIPSPPLWRTITAALVASFFVATILTFAGYQTRKAEADQYNVASCDGGNITRAFLINGTAESGGALGQTWREPLAYVTLFLRDCTRTVAGGGGPVRADDHLARQLVARVSSCPPDLRWGIHDGRLVPVPAQQPHGGINATVLRAVCEAKRRGVRR